MADKYDEAIAYLTDKPEEIELAWSQPYSHKAGCLFAHMKRGFVDGRFFGCLVQIRNMDINEAQKNDLAAAIRADERIPLNTNDITVANLPVFAEWRRRLDSLNLPLED